MSNLKVQNTFDLIIDGKNYGKDAIYYDYDEFIALPKKEQDAKRSADEAERRVNYANIINNHPQPIELTEEQQAEQIQQQINDAQALIDSLSPQLEVLQSSKALKAQPIGGGGVLGG